MPRYGKSVDVIWMSAQYSKRGAVWQTHHTIDSGLTLAGSETN